MSKAGGALSKIEKLSDSYKDMSPCKRFAVVSSLAKAMPDQIRLAKLDPYVFTISWIKNNVRHEVAIKRETAIEVITFADEMGRMDYLLGVEFEAAVKYTDELKTVLPSGGAYKLDKFLRAYKMGLL